VIAAEAALLAPLAGRIYDYAPQQNAVPLGASSGGPLKTFEIVGLVLVVLVETVYFFIVKPGTRKRNRWGVNPDPVECPSCGLLQPKYRLPANLRQVTWGGFTCRECNTEMDKWGRLSLPRGA
jgi:hypothetical protein